MLKRPPQCSSYAIVLAFLCFTTLALVQERTSSADSLMAKLEKDSTTAVKSTEITVSGLVAKIKKSSLIFKSADTVKVICERDSPTTENGRAMVGLSLTVPQRPELPVLMGATIPDQPRPLICFREKCRDRMLVAVVTIGVVVAFIIFASQIAIARGSRKAPEESITDKVRRQELETLLAQSFDGSSRASLDGPALKRKKRWQP
jgi:hypothetical protein